jgi:hypothetical protein
MWGSEVLPSGTTVFLGGQFVGAEGVPELVAGDAAFGVPLAGVGDGDAPEATGVLVQSEVASFFLCRTGCAEVLVWLAGVCVLGELDGVVELGVELGGEEV